MSSALAIAAVTASLRDRINNGLLDQDLSHVGNFAVTAQPPDRITTGATETNQLNLFLYQVTANSGWRNADLPSRNGAGARIANPPLALDLHYLLTAYGERDMNAEILLGYAMQLLHEFPGFSRDQLRAALGAPTPPVDGTLLPGPFGAMSAADLANQVELLKITPNYLSADELSKLWTAMQARYRPSMAYQVSVVLIQGSGSAGSALPVLKRGADDRGAIATAAPFPTLTGARAAASDSLPAIRLGDDVLILGSQLAAAAQASTITALFDNARAHLEQALATAPAAVAGQLVARVPALADRPEAMHEWAVGLYTLGLRVALPGMPSWVTNSVPLALAPRITIAPAPVPPKFRPGDTLSLTCSPRILSGQESGTRVLLGSTALVPSTIATPSGTNANLLLPSTVEVALPPLAPGDYVVRLRIDGIDSLPITLTGSPPKLGFDASQKVSL